MKSILCFGDFNTYGYIPGTGGRYPSHIRWPRVLAQLLGPEWEVVEEGSTAEPQSSGISLSPSAAG